MSYIYQLRDITNNVIGYVGKTDNPPQRASTHAKDANEGYARQRLLGDKRSCKVMSNRETWLTYVCEKRYVVKMEILEECKDRVDEREIYWITELIKQGHPLTNSIGGELMYDADSNPCPYNEPVEWVLIPDWGLDID